MLHSSIYCQQTKGETEQETKKLLDYLGLSRIDHINQMNFQLESSNALLWHDINQ
jgi:hypothetical protein